MNVTDVWNRYQSGLNFNASINLNENVSENENYYIGKQWEGVKSNGLPTPVFNFLKQIVQHQVASITSDNIKMNASALRASANDEDMETLVNVVNNEFEMIMEVNKITTTLREYTRNSAVDGDGCTFTYWDNDTDGVKTEILQNTRVFFGNPNEKSVQRQPWIVIARRDMVDNVKDYAKEFGGEVEAIRPDSDESNSFFDSRVSNKVTRLLYMWKDKKTKSIHAIETTRDAVIRGEYDMMIRVYPVTWLPWDYVQDSYHGQALITGLIPNQQFVNKAYAMSMVSMMMSAFPKIVYDKNRVAKWTNQVGAQIGVNGDVTNIAKVLEPAQISPQISLFINSAIEHTQQFTGATAAALGNTRPDNTSAIVALQRAAAIPSEITKQNLYQSIEDLGRIYIEFMAFYYGKRTVDISVSQLVDEDAMRFANISPAKKMQIDFDFGRLRDANLYIKLDVGASAYWSEIASMQTLDNLLQLRLIDITDYLERIPDGYISKRQELLDKYKTQLSAQAMPQSADIGITEGNIAETEQEEEIPTKRGNSALQRALAQAM